MISTLEQIKTLCNINETTYDNLINELIPLVEEDVIRYTNNDFIDEKFDFFSGQITFQSSDNSINFTKLDEKKLIVGDNIRVYNSYHNNNVFNITSISSTKIIVNDLISINDEDETNTSYITKIFYPLPLKIIFAKMINYNIKKFTDLGVKSETIDNYAVTYENNISGYPLPIIQTLQSYRKVFKTSIFKSGVMYDD